MRVMVMVKATKNSEAGVMPSEKLLADMGKFNEELVKAGIMQAGEGLHPSSKGKRVRFSSGKKTVIDGPFSETKELVAGFWIWQVKSMEEAVEKIRREMPEVVLCDIGLPGMDGIEGIRLLKERYPSLQLLMLTVYDDDERIFRALCAGAHSTIPARLPDNCRRPSTSAGRMPRWSCMPSIVRCN